MDSNLRSCKDSMMTIQQLHSTILAHPLLSPVWAAREQFQLPDCWLVAGCLAQSAWNNLFGLPPAYGISDVDIVYFDPSDLTAEAQKRHAKRIRNVLPDIPAWIDLKNEASVHLWYESRFGYPIAPYRSVKEAIDTFPTTATAVGVRLDAEKSAVYAPFGMDDLLSGTVRANKAQITREIYETKVEKWLSLWPRLRVIDWDAAS